MTCEMIEHELQAYLHEGGEPSMNQAIGDHLAGCTDCQKKLTFLKVSARAVVSLSRHPFPMSAQVEALRKASRPQSPWKRLTRFLAGFLQPHVWWPRLPLALSTGAVVMSAALLALLSKSQFPVAPLPRVGEPSRTIEPVRVNIKNMTDTQWWSGSSWRETDSRQVPQTGWSYGNPGWQSGKQYQIRSAASDHAGNVAGSSYVVTVNGTDKNWNVAPTRAHDAKSIVDSIPSSRGQGASNQVVVINGTNFSFDSAAPVSLNQKIIKTGQLQLEVKKFSDDLMKQIEAVARQAKGFIASSNSYTEASQRRTGTIEVRVPAEAFEAAFIKLEPLGKLLNRSVSGQNVTEEFVDLESRLRNAEKVEAKIQSFLSLAKNSKDAVAILQELDRISERIEQFKDRLRYLSHAVAWSTITVTVSEPQAMALMPERKGVGAYLTVVVQDIAQSSFGTFASVIKGIAVSVSFLLPIALLCGLAGWVYWSFGKRT